MVFGEGAYGEVAYGEAGDSSPTLTLAATLPVPGAAFSVTYTPPPVTASMAATLPVPQVSFTAQTDFISASLAVTLPVPAVSFSATYVPPPVTASLDVTLPVPQVAFTAQSLIYCTFAVTLPTPTLRFAAEYGGPYPTDTSNTRHGRRRLAYATATVERPVAAPPDTVTLATRVDKAVAYPVPTMVDGRPT